MIEINIPGKDILRIEHLVLDYNGTIAVDGTLIESVQERLQLLLPQVSIHVLTADTYGTVEAQCATLGLQVEKFPREGAAGCKKAVVERLDNVCAIGNGYNDIPMFDLAELAIAVLEAEGMCSSLLLHADVVTKSITDALDLLLKPDRLRATLRS
ncbi:MAG: HAD hydrolase family protein [Clostridia bacterium]|nr:HAD hydrolase family protein [Clostridia bacterium]